MFSLSHWPKIVIQGEENAMADFLRFGPAEVYLELPSGYFRLACDGEFALPPLLP